MTRRRRARYRDGARRMWERRARAVVDLDTDRTFPTAKAAAKALRCTPALVSMVLSGKVKAAKGHQLRWQDEPPQDAASPEGASAPPREVFRGGAAPSLPAKVGRSDVKMW